MVKVGVIGPVAVSRTANILGLSLIEYEGFIKNVGRMLAEKETELVICPEKGAVTICAEGFKVSGGHFISGVLPRRLKSESSARLRLELCDNLILVPNWTYQPPRLVKESHILVVLGLGRGVMIEICWALLYPMKQIAIFEKLLSKPLHAELQAPNFLHLNDTEELGCLVDQVRADFHT